MVISAFRTSHLIDTGGPVRLIASDICGSMPITTGSRGIF
jgi:hypothetical protein